jgi:peptidyl-dipeptidase A
MEKIQSFIKAHEKIIKPIYKNAQKAYWAASISGKEEDFKKYEILAKKYSKLYNNKSEFEKIKEFKSKNIPNPILKRQIDILYNNYLSSQGDLSLINKIIEKQTKIEQKFNTFRARVDGQELTDNEIKDILRTEKDSKKLQAVWEANKKQGELVEKELLEIISLRNKLAQSLNFKNYYEFSLTVSDLFMNQQKIHFKN